MPAHQNTPQLTNAAEGSRLLLNLFIQTAQELEFQLEASKGGNVRGVTEDHRYGMAKQLHTIRSVIVNMTAKDYQTHICWSAANV